MNPRLPPGPFRAYRRDGKLVLEIDEHRFCADAFLESHARILDRDAFLAFTCDTVFELLHDDDDAEGLPTWWRRFPSRTRRRSSPRFKLLSVGVTPDIVSYAKRETGTSGAI